MEIKILGIAGSARNQSGSRYALEQALLAAKEIDADVTTRLISLRGKKISMCVHCDNCVKNKSLCCIKDDFQEVQQAFLEADAYIFSSPVYNMTATPIFHAFMSRIRPTLMVDPGHFTGKVGGAICVGGGRNSGQEMTLLSFQNFFYTYEILSCGGSLHEPAGAALCSVDGSFDGARNDIQGIESARRLGKRIAQTSAILKYGCRALENEGKTIYHTEGWWEC